MLYDYLHDLRGNKERQVDDIGRRVATGDWFLPLLRRQANSLECVPNPHFYRGRS